MFKVMDYRKDMNTPRDMIEDEMLLRLMKEAEPYAATFGGNVRRENRRRNVSGTCRCRNELRGDDRREDRSGDHCPGENEYRNRSSRSDSRNCRDAYTIRENCGHRSADSDCGCGNAAHHTADYETGSGSCEPCANDEHMKHFRLAMAYVPWQEWEKIYEDEAALSRGTLFEALDLPWYPSACDGKSDTCRTCGDHR